MSCPGSPVVIRALLTTLSGLAAVAVVLGDMGAPVQPVLVLWFVLVCPGMAFVGLIRPPSLLFALTLSIAVSCALAVMVSQALLFAGAWSPVTGLVVLAGLTVVGAGADLRAARRAGPVGVDTSEGR
ncbi:hypothetical protein [Nocardioides terrigena]|uniref:hypothetical protein n=1 Tax=Nocardioides terrigena TaxID=424797 RepID=UPI000D30AF00|nr:hypothetical protein [Nocardioides terrigena]